MKKLNNCSSMKNLKTEINHIDDHIIMLLSLRAKYSNIVKVRDRYLNKEWNEIQIKVVIDPHSKIVNKFGLSPQLFKDIYYRMVNDYLNGIIDK